MILVLDSYDSFVHNLARYVREAGEPVEVVRSDRLTVREVLETGAAGAILSPGPCTPAEAGVGRDLVRWLSTEGHSGFPVLGVCLGHQVVAEALGGRLKPASPPRHGVACQVTTVNPGPLLAGLPPRFPAGLYHSLSVDAASLPHGMEVHAVDESGEVMAIAHPTLPLLGVQFHPESVLTPDGRTIVRNFLDIVRSGA